MLAELADDFDDEFLERLGTDVTKLAGRCAAVFGDIAATVVEVGITFGVFLTRGLGSHEVPAMSAMQEAFEEELILVAVGVGSTFRVVLDESAVCRSPEALGDQRFVFAFVLDVVVKDDASVDGIGDDASDTVSDPALASNLLFFSVATRDRSRLGGDPKLIEVVSDSGGALELFG